VSYPFACRQINVQTKFSQPLQGTPRVIFALFDASGMVTAEISWISEHRSFDFFRNLLSMKPGSFDSVRVLADSLARLAIHGNNYAALQGCHRKLRAIAV
jgi:hypothetical protein